MGNRSRPGKRERQMSGDKNYDRNGGKRINPACRTGSQSDAKAKRTNQN